MDNLYCYGDESNITSCPFDGWGTHDCTAQEAAGVVCEDPSLITTTTVPMALVDSALSVQIANDQAGDMKKGRIRVRANESDDLYLDEVS